MENRIKITAETIESLIRKHARPRQVDNKPKSVKEFEISADCENFDFTKLGSFLLNCSVARFNGSRVPRLRDLGVSWANLEVLYLHRCKLKDVSGISALPRLRMLFAAFNEVEDLNALGVSRSLEVLDFEENNVQALTNMQCLGQCTNLTHLTLVGNPIANLVYYRRVVGSLLAVTLECLDDEKLTDEERLPVLDESEASIMNIDAVKEAEVERVVAKAIKLTEISRNSCITPLSSLTSKVHKSPIRRPRTALGIRRPTSHQSTRRSRRLKHPLPPRPSTATPTRRKRAAWMFGTPTFPESSTVEMAPKDTSSSLTFGSMDEVFRGSPIVALRRRRKMKLANKQLGNNVL